MANPVLESFGESPKAGDWMLDALRFIKPKAIKNYKKNGTT
jgi:hypothetical protein